MLDVPDFFPIQTVYKHAYGTKYRWTTILKYMYAAATVFTTTTATATATAVTATATATATATSTTITTTTIMYIESVQTISTNKYINNKSITAQALQISVYKNVHSKS